MRFVLSLFLAGLVFAAWPMPASARSARPMDDEPARGTASCVQIDKDGISTPMHQFALEVGETRARLTGVLDVPTPGYTAGLEGLQAEGKNMTGRLVLTAPDGLAQQAIKSLEIDLPFELLPRTRILTLDVQKPFGWGPVQIICVFGALNQ